MNLETILSRVVVIPNGCWEWQGYRNQNGYAKSNGRLVHRAVFEAMIGPVPLGLTLDHLCRVRHCLNPTHLEPVTHRENVLRGTSFIVDQVKKTHCPLGHELSLPPWKKAKRECRTCETSRLRARRRAA